MIVFSHEASAGHVTPEGHPERVARLAAVERGLAGFNLERRQSPLADEADLLRCHGAAYVARIRAAEPLSGTAQLDADTWMSAGSFAAASRAVGGAYAAVDAVMAEGNSSSNRRAFVVSRPPGHHAERATPMGFCLFGTVAIAAKRALQVHGLSRVAVVDFDVHHGNGTQDLLWDEPGVRFVSSQQMPLWPGTGEATERGAHGQIMNVPLAPGSGGAAMRAAYEGVFAWLDTYAPELVLISAGFDAHVDDPLAGLAWLEEDYVWLTERLCGLAERHARGRVVSCLEGGYDLGALERSVAAHVGVLKERADG